MRGLVVGIAAGGLALAAAAQDAPVPRSQLVECLQPAAGARTAPVYPEAWIARQEGGTWTFDLVFDAPDAPPRVVPPRTVLSKGEMLHEDFVRSVRDYARQLRMPCLPAGESVRLQQEFAFVPNGSRKVTLSREREGGTPAAGAAGCQALPSDGSVRPRVPLGSWHGPQRQTALLSYTFRETGQPPQVDILVGTPTPMLTDVATEWARGLRLTCTSTQPRHFIQLFVFSLAGGPREVLRDLPLIDFLRSVRNLEAKPVYFDFARMGCPFEARLTVMQPYAPNGVVADGANAPERRPFLDWLAGLALKLPERDLNAVLGQSMTLTVPCGTLDL